MKFSRRQFLHTSAICSFGSLAPSFLQKTAFTAASKKVKTDRVLVVLQLSGGNDGLNTIVPYADDEYGRNRSTLRLQAPEVHKIDSYCGFHYEMKAMWEQFQDGHVSVIQSVGYPKSNRDHAGALRDWYTAYPHDENCETGWLGRSIEYANQVDHTDLPGVLVGNISMPLALNAERTIVPSIRRLDQMQFQQEPLSADIHKTDNALLDFVNQQTSIALEKSRKLTNITKDIHSSVEYPPFQLAKTLRTAAQLIRADIGVCIIYTALGGDGFGGFDNHASQRDNHAALLRQLSESVSAFINDLKHDRLLDRVLLTTVSEFGRTLKENGRRGTGHGAAAPMLAAGAQLKPGLIGQCPSLTDLDDGALKHQIDFRNVFAALLDQWLCIDSKEILGVSFDPIPLFQS